MNYTQTYTRTSLGPCLLVGVLFFLSSCGASLHVGNTEFSYTEIWMYIRK